MKKLYLGSKDDRKLLGVFGGIGETYDIDPTIIRVVIVAIGLMAWPLLIPLALSYLAAWALIPAKPAD